MRGVFFLFWFEADMYAEGGEVGALSVGTAPGLVEFVCTAVVQCDGVVASFWNLLACGVILVGMLHKNRHCTVDGRPPLCPPPPPSPLPDVTGASISAMPFPK